jgi:hypothetical protein
VERRIAQAEKRITEVAKDIKAVQGQIAGVAIKIEGILTELDKADPTTDKKGRLDLLLKSLFEEKKSLFEEKKSLFDKEKSLFDKEKALMEMENLLNKQVLQLDRASAAPPSLEGVRLSIPGTFNFDVSSWQVGDIVDCSALSEAMLPFGGFPSSLFVREEMKAVWSILWEGIVENRSKWVLVGSPGVGKSVLAVLLSFHLAKSCNKPVFLARQLKGEGMRQNVVAICIRPGGEAEGFTKAPNVMFSLDEICSAFEVRHEMVTYVLDGWSQQELAQSEEGRSFGGFNLLVTSAQYIRKGQDVRKLVMLPAWSEADLRSHCGIVIYRTIIQEETG